MSTAPANTEKTRDGGNDFAAFAEFILKNRDEITRHWVTAVDRSPRVKASEDLTFQQLLDHLPQLCSDLAERLGGTETVTRHSTAHGRKRWQQGYRLDELIRELSIIRLDFVGRWFDAFEEGNGPLSRERRRQARATVHQFFDDTIASSVMQYVEEKERNAQESHTALNAAKEEATEARRAKNNFINLVSHELRTPLTPILLSAAALSEDDSLTPKVREFVAVVQQYGKMEAGLIDDLLDASEMTRRGLRLVRAPVDVHECLSAAIKVCEREFEARQIRLTVRMQAAIAHVLGHERRLRRAFTTLVRNAINVTAHGGDTVIETRNIDEQIEVAFQDTGPMLDADALRRLFSPFEEGRRSAEFGLGGLGLSRYVCKRLIETHGGQILAEPVETNRGAILSVRLTTIS